MIYKDKYDLSETIVLRFYRWIWDIYVGNNNKALALRWHKLQLQLNTKLGVKKLVVIIENQLSES